MGYFKLRLTSRRCDAEILKEGKHTMLSFFLFSKPSAFTNLYYLLILERVLLGTTEDR